MNNLELVGAIMKTAKQFGGGEPRPPQGGPGAGGPPPEKKFLMMLNLMLPEQPVPLVGRICGLNPPVAVETARAYEEKGLVVLKTAEDGDREVLLVSISEAGRALIESERAEHLKQMEAQRQKHIAECDAKLAVLTEDEKETLAALLAKLA